MCAPLAGVHWQQVSSPAVPVILLLALVAAVPAASAGTDTDWAGVDPETVQVWLVTAAPGHRDPSAWYGHSGLLVSDGQDTVYYGYRVDQVGDWWRVFKTGAGASLFHLEAIPYAEILAEYAWQGREVRLMELRTGAAERLALAQALAAEAADGTWVKYHSVHDNCSTRVRDHIDAALGGTLRDATEGVPGTTLRDAVTPYLQHRATSVFAIHGILGPGGDRMLDEWELGFLPLGLERSLQALRGEDGQAVAGPAVVVQAAAPDVLHAPVEGLVLRFLLAGLAAAAMLVALGAWAARAGAGRRVLAGTCLALAVVGTPLALLLLVISTGIIDPLAAGNENLLLLSPVLVLLAPPAWRALRGDSARAWETLRDVALLLAVLAAAALALKLLPGAQDNRLHLAFFVPAYLGLAASVAWPAARLARA